jgi:hypothetical protein
MADIKKQVPQAAKPQLADSKKTVKAEFAFGKQNYTLMFIGLGFLLLGFILMIGGGSDDPKVFSPALFDFQRLTLSPLLLLTGYIIEIFAIMKRPKEEKAEL